MAQLDASATVEPRRLSAENLDDRQIRGVLRARAADRSNALVIPVNESTTLWMSKRGNHAWLVERELRNRRGKLTIEYRCACGDFQKNGRNDCEHTFADQTRRGEIIIDGTIEHRRAESARGGRRPSRKRLAADGRSQRSAQRDARATCPERVPELLRELAQVLEREATTPYERQDISRAFALAFKIAEGKSNDAMLTVYGRHIESGVLRLRNIPHQNTLCRWMNNEELTPVLQRVLEITARPFRAIECAGIVDSSKMSQMRSAHSRWVEYGDDVREDADWMKMHALVGVETLICMGVKFSGSRGEGSHDINFLLPLVRMAQGTFRLRHVLADKAYLAEDIVGKLFEMGIKAIIPIKKRWDFKNAKRFYDVLQNLVQWYDTPGSDFQEYYRLRPKVESFFSLLKHFAGGFCWSRGRPRKDPKGEVLPIENAVDPCTAWINESLCKVIYVNLRLTVEREITTGYKANYLIDMFFPDIAAAEKLIA